MRIIEKVRSIAAGRSIDIRIFDHTDLNNIHTALKKAGFPSDLLMAIDLNSYGGVRNMGLLYAAMHGFEHVVMIDDDECIDADYQKIAIESMGEQLNGQEILGKTGCVVDSEGRKFYDGQASLDWKPGRKTRFSMRMCVLSWKLKGGYRIAQLLSVEYGVAP